MPTPRISQDAISAGISTYGNDDSEIARQHVKRILDAAAPFIHAVELAQLEIAQDVLHRLLMFDGGPELMSWAQIHGSNHLKRNVPYIGCPFCRPLYDLRTKVVEECVAALRTPEAGAYTRTDHPADYLEEVMK